MLYHEINSDNFAHYIKVLPDAVLPHGIHTLQLKKKELFLEKMSVLCLKNLINKYTNKQ